MKRLIALLALGLLVSGVAMAQFVPGYSLNQKFGTRYPQFVTATDTARDTALYLHGLNADIGGGAIFYGITIADSASNINPNLVLAYSADSVSWTEIDSVAVTPELEATTWKFFDATLLSAPYWRIRFCSGAVGDALRGATADGEFTFFLRFTPK